MKSPGVKYNGLTASLSQAFDPPPTPTVNSHTPLFLVLSSDGTDNAMLVNGLNVSGFGDIGQAKGSVHRTHQNAYLSELIKNNGTAIVKRIILPDAARATLRVSLEVILSSLPLFDRDEYGQYIQDEYGDPIPIGVMDGLRTIVHVESTSTVGTANVIEHYRTGSELSPITGEYLGVVEINEQLYHPDSVLYPFFDLEYAHFGSGGNDLQIEISQGVVSPFRLVISKITGVKLTDIEFSLDGDMDRLDVIELPNIRRAALYAESIRSAKEVLINGLDYRGVHYNGVDAYLEIFEEDIVSTEAKRNLPRDFDFFGLTFKDGIPYPMVVNDSKWFEGSSVGLGYPLLMTGGGDGYPLTVDGRVDRLELLRVFDTMASALYRSISLGHHNLSDPVRYPYRSIYDSGYSMQTKRALVSIKRSRPEVQVFLTPYSVADWLPRVGSEIACSGASIDAAVLASNSGERYTLEIDGQVIARDLNLLQLYTALNNHSKVEAELLQQPIRDTRFVTSLPYPREEDFELASSFDVLESRMREVPGIDQDVDILSSFEVSIHRLATLTIDATIPETDVTANFGVTGGKLQSVVVDAEIEETDVTATFSAGQGRMYVAAIDTKIEETDIAASFGVATSSLKVQG